MATLKSLVDETTNIKNEIKTCHANLKNNLIEKGVECSDTDKMLILINKVCDISLESLGGIRWSSGTVSGSSSTSTYKYRNNSDSLINGSYYTYTVKNLGFDPLMVVLHETNTGGNVVSGLFIRNGKNNLGDILCYSNGTWVYINDKISDFSNGFKMPNEEKTKVHWYAFG